MITIARLVTSLARRLGGEIVVPLVQAAMTAPLLLSLFRQVGAHLWRRGPVVSRKQRDSNPGNSALACLRQAL